MFTLYCYISFGIVFVLIFGCVYTIGLSVYVVCHINLRSQQRKGFLIFNHIIIINHDIGTFETKVLC